MVLEFGRAIAKLADDPLTWRQPIMAAYEATPLNDRNLGMIAGYFAGLAERDANAVEEFKEEAAQLGDIRCRSSTPMREHSITEKDIELVCQALKAGVIPARMMMQWAFGAVLAKLSPNSVTPLFHQLFTMGERGFSVAIELMGMYVHGNAQRLEHLRPQLRQAANYPALRGERHGSHMDEHHFTQMMKWVLAKGSKDADARAIAMTLAKQLAADPDGDGRSLIKSLLPQLMKEFPEIVWPQFGQAIVSDRMKAWRFEHALGDSYSFSDVKQPAILYLPEDTLFAWCHAHPDVGPAFVAAIAPVLTTRDPNATDRQFHPLVSVCWMSLATAKMFCERLTAISTALGGRAHGQTTTHFTKNLFAVWNIIPSEPCAGGPKEFGKILAAKLNQCAMKMKNAMRIGRFRPGSEAASECTEDLRGTPGAAENRAQASDCTVYPVQAEPVLEEAHYQHILNVINNMTLVMERSPTAFQEMGEENIRQHYLVQLNGHFEGAATG